MRIFFEDGGENPILLSESGANAAIKTKIHRQILIPSLTGSLQRYR